MVSSPYQTHTQHVLTLDARAHTHTPPRAATASGNDVVIRIPAPDASEHGQDQRIVCVNARAAAACGVAPEVVDFDDAQGVIVTRFITGTTLTKSALANDASGQLLVAFVGV